MSQRAERSGTQLARPYRGVWAVDASQEVGPRARSDVHGGRSEYCRIG